MTGAPSAGRARAALGAALALCTVAIFWTANGVAPWDADTSNVWHQYEYLTEGFRHGHTYLSVEPPPGLLRLKDPYDPIANAPYRMWDTSLYAGKYYLYQGPAPALLVMLPWRLATGHMLPQRLAVAVFAAGGLAGLALLLWEVRRRHFPGLTAPCFAFVILVAFCASWLPVTLRRSALWELPVVAAAACLWWALYFLWKFHDSRGRTGWAAAAGMALALLIGCRAAALFGAGAIALLLLVPAGAPGAAPRWRPALLAMGIVAAGGIALLLYNLARFGNPLDFGLHYTLFGEDYRAVRYSSLGFIPFNLWVYLFSAPQAGPYFPFLHPFWTDARPPGYVGFEEVYGIGFMMPVHLAGLVALGWAWTNRAAAGMRAAAVTVAGACLASAFAAFILFAWAWACSRFITEIVAGWTVLTSVGLMVVLTAQPRRPLVRFLACAAACWSMACVGLASADFRGFMRQTHPRTFAELAHTLDYPSLWWARAHHVEFGPVEMSVRVDRSTVPRRTALMASGRPQNENQMLLDQDASGMAQVFLVENDHVVLATPALPPRFGRFHLHVEAPWLYPPPEHPYWDGVGPALRRDLQTRFLVDWDDGVARVNANRAADPVGFAPVILGAEASGTGMPWVEGYRRVDPEP